MDCVLSRLSESEEVDALLDSYLFDESATKPVQEMEGTLPFAELEVAVRARLYKASVYLKRCELAADIQVEQLLKEGLALLAKTAIFNDYPTDTVLYGELDQAVYRECIARLQARQDNGQQEDPSNAAQAGNAQQPPYHQGRGRSITNSS